MRFTSVFAAAFIFLMGSLSSLQAQELVAYWNQNSNEVSPGVFGFSPASFPQAADSGIGNIVLTNFMTDTGATGLYSFVPSFAGTTINARGTDPSGGSLSIQGGTNNGNNGAHLDIQVSMTGRQNLILSYATRRTSSGFSTQTYAYSTDGTNFTVFGADSNINASAFELKTVDFSAVSALTNAANVTIRITVDGATTVTGNTRFDNIQINATPLVVSTTSIVTFQVDMQYQTVSPQGVHIAGNFQGWNPSATPMTQSTANPSIWTYTDTFTVGQALEYKYVNGNSWGSDESVPAACQVNNNRGYTVAAGNPTLPLVCYGACTACLPQRAITFQVDMTGQTVSGPVHIAGSFNGWSATADTMTPGANNIYSRTYQLIEGTTHQYKFLNGPSFTNAEAVPSACGVPDGFGGFNREVMIGNANASLPAVQFGTCNVLVAAPTFPVRSIASLRNVDSLGVADSVGATVAVYGTVVSHNIRLNGMQYVINDGTGGITIFRASGNFGLGQLSIGDSLWAQGTVTQFNGLLQVAIDTAVFIGPGSVPAPVVVTSVGEPQENELIRLNAMEIVSGTWPAAGSTSSGVNLTLRSTIDTSFTITARVVPNSTDLGGNGPTTPVFDIIGVGGQFDNSSPFTSGYQIFPRRAADILPVVVTTPVQVTFQVDIDTLTPGPGGVRVAGTFNGWAPNSANAVMTRIGTSSIYEATYTLTTGDSVQYKFLLDSVWSADEMVPAACGFGSASPFNRLLVVPASNITLPAVVFGTCSPAQPVLSIVPISVIKTNNANGVPDSLGTRQRLTGTLHGLNHYRSTSTPVGIQFIMIDATGGTTIRKAGTNFGIANLAEGDSVIVEGVVEQFQGLTQMNVDTVIRVATGRTLRTPLLVTEPSEATENEYIRIENLSITGGTWPAAGSNGFITVSNGTSTFTMFIISVLNQPQWPQPTGFFNVEGFGAQSTTASPFNTGYQIVPMRASDITPVVVSNPTVNFARTDTLITNAVTNFPMFINILNPLPTAQVLKVAVSTSAGVVYGPSGNYSTTPAVTNDTITVNVAAGAATAGFGVALNGNVPVGRTDTMTFNIVAAGNYTIGALSSSRVRVQNPPPPSYRTLTIGQIRGNDTNGLADSIGVRVRTRGVVMGFNKRPAGLEFHIFDRTSNNGISVFRATGNLGYNVAEGDSVEVVGMVAHFNGLSQINVDSVHFISPNNTLPATELVTVLNEYSESRLVRLNGLSLVDPTQWPTPGTTGSGRNVNVTNGTDVFVVRIVAPVDLFGTAAPTGTFDFVGIGGQFFSAFPHTGGYQLVPRYMADLITSGGGQDSLTNFSLLSPPNNATLTVEGAQSTAVDISWARTSWTGGAATITYEWLLDLPTGDFSSPVATLPANNSGADSVLTLTFGQIAALLDANSVPQGASVPLKWTVRASRTGSMDTKMATQAFNITLVRGIMSNVNEQNPLASISLFPNPATGSATLSFDAQYNKALQLEVIDMIGKRVRNEVIHDASTGRVQIDLAGLQQGVYFVRLSNGEHSAVRRLVVKH
ncbi:MAG: T9SS type A sorting domain-containing protein [Bacteroidia bacterium]